jgi:hypothetical protein
LLPAKASAFEIKSKEKKATEPRYWAPHQRVTLSGDGSLLAEKTESVHCLWELFPAEKREILAKAVQE